MGKSSVVFALCSVLMLFGCGGDDGDGGSDASTSDGGGNADAPAGADAAIDANLDPFSFFVASYATMQLQSGSVDGFGGNFGGLAGADQICQTAAANVGFDDRTWRAFLSVTDDGSGNPVNAIDRIGSGPWYDRAGRLISNDIAGLLNARPAGDPQAVADMLDENGAPLSDLGDAHDIVTASDLAGELNSMNPDSTCNDWTSADGNVGGGTVRAGHSFPRMGGGRGIQWISDHNLRGCAPGVNFEFNGAGSGDCIGCSGGYGGIYCFAVGD